MKLIISRDQLHAAISAIARIVESRNTIPILSNVWIGAKDDALKLRATDLDIEAEASAPARISAPGTTTVRADALRDIVSKTPVGAEMSFEIDSDHLLIRTGRSKFRLLTLPAHDFPDLAALVPTHTFSVPISAIERLFSKASIAISTEETRYYLNGIYFHVINGRVRCVATDGHRLTQIDGPEIEGIGNMHGVILPRKAIAELGRLVGKGSGDIEIAVSPTKVSVTFPSGVRITSKLIDGTFPDYARVVPKDNTIVCDLNRPGMMAAIERVTALGKTNKLSLSAAHGTLSLDVNDPDSGSAHDEINAVFSAPFQVAMNPRYLLDILGVMTGEKVQFKVKDPGSPMLLLDLGDSDSAFVLMPLR